MDMITIEVEGKRRKVAKADYIKAKTEQLREFGYDSLTEDEVTKQLDIILSDGNVNVIGMFMKDEIIHEV